MKNLESLEILWEVNTAFFSIFLFSEEEVLTNFCVLLGILGGEVLPVHGEGALVRGAAPRSPHPLHVHQVSVAPSPKLWPQAPLFCS